MDKAAIQTLVSELYTAVKPFPELQKIIEKHAVNLPDDHSGGDLSKMYQEIVTKIAFDHLSVSAEATTLLKALNQIFQKIP
ncbi:MAG: hypothetical protein IKF08_06425, partial [Lactococcus sp.]|nr:hypothetical protein [Lactococcus sp.]